MATSHTLQHALGEAGPMTDTQQKDLERKILREAHGVQLVMTAFFKDFQNAKKTPEELDQHLDQADMGMKKIRSYLQELRRADR